MRSLLSGHLGLPGAAVPYAVAARFAAPDRPVIVLVGDGALQGGGLNEPLTVRRHLDRLAALPRSCSASSATAIRTGSPGSAGPRPAIRWSRSPPRSPPCRTPNAHAWPDCPPSAATGPGTAARSGPTWSPDADRCCWSPWWTARRRTGRPGWARRTTPARPRSARPRRHSCACPAERTRGQTAASTRLTHLHTCERPVNFVVAGGRPDALSEAVKVG
ncbi:thiamine pyrophosphate-dependent enzyme [Streptomyces olivaceoviridis]|uniref:thiamine pyrophosphate-dependent enzyme n=1 Tax=Streptomyces olivaceoviridis TaxID=1921 RepID=UPI001E2883B1|nr:thiamine pyrophosphate-dependent enzyme [Streptomyces olivaceoviridis]